MSRNTISSLSGHQAFDLGLLAGISAASFCTAEAVAEVTSELVAPADAPPPLLLFYICGVDL